MVVVGDDASLLVEHWGEHTALDALDGQQVVLLLSSLFHQRILNYEVCRLKFLDTQPFRDFPRQQGLVGADFQMARSWPRHHVGLSLCKLRGEFGGVSAYLHPDAHTETVGQPLHQQELRTKLTAMVVVVGLWAADGDQYQLAAVLDLVEVEALGSFYGVEHLTPGRNDGLLLLRGAGKQQQNCQKCRIFI